MTTLKHSHLQHKALLSPAGVCAFTQVFLCIASNPTAFSSDADSVVHGALRAKNIYKVNQAEYVGEQK